MNDSFGPGILSQPLRQFVHPVVDNVVQNVIQNIEFLTGFVKDLESKTSKVETTATQTAQVVQEVTGVSIDGVSGGGAGGGSDLSSNTVISDTHNFRVTTYMGSFPKAGTLYYEIDRNALYVVSLGLNGVLHWQLLASFMQDAMGNRPADLGVYDTGFLFLDSATKLITIWDGTAWFDLRAIAVFKHGAYADRPAVTADDDGLVYYATDQNATYIVEAGIWTWLCGVMWGTITPDTRPALAVTDVGFVFYGTDTKVYYLWTGVAWDDGFAGQYKENTFTKSQTIKPDSDAATALILQWNSGTHSGDMLEIQNDAATVLTRIDNDGKIGVLTGAAAIVGNFQVLDTVKFDPTNFNVLLGYQAGDNDNGQNNLFVGYQAGYYNDTTGGGDEGDDNVYMGYKAGYGVSGPVTPNTGHHNVYIGYQSGYSNTSGYDNCFVGTVCGYSITSGNLNVGIGRDALNSLTSGRFNMALGANALEDLLTGLANTAVGYSAGAALNAGESYNTLIGYASGLMLDGGDSNVFIGYRSGMYQVATSSMLIIDNQTRGNAATELTNCLVVGTFDAILTNQWLRFNGLVGINKQPNGTMLDIVSLNAAYLGLRIKAYAAQSANIAQFVDSSDLTKAWVDVTDNGNDIAGPSIGVGRNASIDTEGPAAGTFRFTEADGTAHYMWFDSNGNLREHSAAPTGSTGSPTVEDDAGNVIGPSPRMLTADTTFYVRTDGNDSNDGTANDADHAWATPQGGIDYIRQFINCAGFNVTIQVGDGTYSGDVGGDVLRIPIIPNLGTLVIQGNAGTPSNVLFDADNDAVALVGINISYKAGENIFRPVVLKDFKVQAVRCGVYADHNAAVEIDGIDFGACAVAHIRAVRSASVIITDDYTISGNSGYHYMVESSGYVSLDPWSGATHTITLNGVPAFSVAFAHSSQSGWIDFEGGSSITFAGAATGVRFIAHTHGEITTPDNDKSYFPGNAAGYVHLLGTWNSRSNREVLIANRSYYVRVDGNDDNDGLVDSAARAFLTLQKAADTIAALDLNGFDVTVYIGNGTYTAGISIPELLATGGNVYLEGDTGTPSNVLISLATGTCITSRQKCNLYVKGVKWTTAAGHGVMVIGGRVILENVIIGACSGYGVYATATGFIQFDTNFEVDGNCGTVIGLNVASNINCIGKTVTITGGPTWSSVFAYSNASSLLNIYTCTFVGAAIGVEYYAAMNGIINTNGGGPGYLPGSIGGTTASGGQYI